MRLAVSTKLRRKFKELAAIEDCVALCKSSPEGKVKIEAEVSYRNELFPIYSFTFGSRDENAPTLAFVAGVHGLEKIGSHILTSFLSSTIQLLTIDKTLSELIKDIRLVFIPLVNPVGMYANRRSNGQGIDLMRNAPIDSAENGIPLVRGHRISSRLPWYRGKDENCLQTEAKAVIDVIKKTCFKSKASVVLDLHSGFGLVDRLWFPHAHSTKPIADIGRIYALKSFIDISIPHHNYRIEPQHKAYTTHGDIWDYLYLESKKNNPKSIFCPFSLEMGSWLWVKKNPIQIFSSLGMFNPIRPHRVRRIHRRHYSLLNVLLKAIASTDAWATIDQKTKRQLDKKALELWYAG
jgi:hypothetical protein